MGRSKKTGLTYFNIDCDEDMKIKLLKKKYGVAGTGLYREILRLIYIEGYFIKFDDDAKELVMLESLIDEDKFNEMLDYLFKKNFFNTDLYENQKILTSKGIQKRYLTIVKLARRATNTIDKYCLISSEEMNITSEEKMKSSEDTQKIMKKVHKEKKRKEKEIKLKKNKYLEFVKLSDDEYKKLVEQFTENGAKSRIENLNLYIGSKGDKYKSHYHTILSWERKNNKNNKAQNNANSELFDIDFGDKE